MLGFGLGRGRTKNRGDTALNPNTRLIRQMAEVREVEGKRTPQRRGERRERRVLEGVMRRRRGDEKSTCLG
jgi:hypothetical protein